MSGTPAHCKIIFSDKSVLRFDCSKKDTEAVFGFLKTKSISTEYYNKPKDIYRN